MQDAAIDVQRLARRYGRRWALADVSFTVPAGSVLMVSGHNGAGKSTLFRILATAIRPDRGTARVAGFDVVTHRQDVRKRTAILGHQNYLYESLTAKENLQVVADHLRTNEPVLPLLERVGLAPRANDLVSTFSAGMRKRLAFARVLLQRPSIVLLDEPYGALDAGGFDLVDTIVRDFRTAGATVLLATHQWERGQALADAALVLEAGRVTGSPGYPVTRSPGGGTP